MSRSGRRDFLKLAGAMIAVPLAAGPVRGQVAPRRRIKVGQVGVGHAHANKLAVFRASPEYEVVGLAEPDAELRVAAEKQPAFRDIPWMTEEQLLNLPGLELVLVETRVPQLLDVAEACVRAGKHIHLDKPAGQSLAHFRRILAEARRRKLLVQMGYMYRYNPAVVLLRQFLRDGWLGELFAVHAVMSKVVPPADRLRLAQSGGSMMFELGCHLIDLIVALLGEPTAVDAYAQHVSPLADSLLDSTLAVLTYPRALVTVQSSALEIDGGQRRHLVACGNEGTFHIQPLDNPSSRVTLTRQRGSFRKGYQDVNFPTYVRYVDDAADIARILRGEKEADLSYDHDLAVQETLLNASKLPVDS